jgi:hypothetical protein
MPVVVGHSFFGVDGVFHTRNPIGPPRGYEIRNANFDEILVRNNVQPMDDVTGEKPPIWLADFVLNVKFQGSLMGGSIGMEGMTHIMVKRRRITESKWMTIEIFEVPEFWDVATYDDTVQATEWYVYGLAPARYDEETGEYVTGVVS